MTLSVQLCIQRGSSEAVCHARPSATADTCSTGCANKKDPTVQNALLLR